MYIGIGPSVSGDDEYRLLLENASRLEAASHRMVEERADCLRRANALRCSTRALPNEILATIFMFAAPPIDFETRPFCEPGDEGVGGEDDDEDAEDDSDDDSDDEEEEGNDDNGDEDGDGDDGGGSDDGANDGHSDEGDFCNYWEEEDLGYRYFPLVLSAVSSQWKQVALSTPGLWTTLAIEVNCGQIEKQAELLRHYLQNSKGLLFSFDLNFRRHGDQLHRLRNCPHLASFCPVHTCSGPIMRVLLGDSNRERLRTLRLVKPPQDWIASAPLSFLKITNLALGCDPFGEIYNISFPPSLQQLMIVRALINPYALPSNLTVIQLRRVPIDNGIKLLLHSPQLKEFHNYDPTLPQSPLITRPFTHPNIEIFGWTWQTLPVGCHDYLLGHLRLPKLRRFIWDRSFGRDEEGLGILTLHFIDSLPRTLLSLDLSRIGAYIDDPNNDFRRLEATFACLDHIEELTLVKCSRFFIKSLFLFLGCPTPRDPRNLVLPNLKIIRIRGPVCTGNNGIYSWHNPCLDLSYCINSFIRARGQLLKISGFRLELIGCGPVYDRVFLKKLLKIVQSGIRLEVAEGSKMVSW